MLEFPLNPEVGQQFTVDAKAWRWNGFAWDTMTVSDTQVQRAEEAVVAVAEHAAEAAASVEQAKGIADKVEHLNSAVQSLVQIADITEDMVLALRAEVPTIVKPQLDGAVAAKVAAEAARDATIAGQSAGMIGKDTLVNLNADLTYPAGTVALVTNDLTPSKNTFYRKLGASGAGSWVVADANGINTRMDDPQRLFHGYYFSTPTYEFSGGSVYLRPVSLTAGVQIFWNRGGYFPAMSCDYNKILADLGTPDPAFVVPNVTSPGGLTGCIQFKHAAALYYNPTTNTFWAGARTTKTGFVLLINSEYGLPGPCAEREEMERQRLLPYVDEPSRTVPGLFFNDPYYEWSGTPSAGNAILWFKPKGYGGSDNIFFIRGGYYADITLTQTQMLADFGVTDATIAVNQTSPLGVTGCIKINPAGCIWYNPVTKKFFAGARARKPGWIKLVENNAGVSVGDCTEKAAIIECHLKRLIADGSADPAFLTPGLQFSTPYVEWVGNVGSTDMMLYFKPIGHMRTVANTTDEANCFFARGGYYPSADISYAKIKADIGVLAAGSVITGVTSPGGVTDCIQFKHAGALYYDPIAKKFYAGERAKKLGFVKILENNSGTPGDGTEQAWLYYKLLETKLNAVINSGTATGGVMTTPLMSGFEVVAHRGLTAYGAPENSLDAYIHAGMAGYKYAESDLLYTADNKLIILHDDSINRTYTMADGSPIVGTVNIWTITLAQAQSLYKQKGSIEKYRKPMPTMEQWCATVKKAGLLPYIELKSLQPFMEADFIATMRKFFRDNEVTVIAFNDLLLNRLAPQCGFKLGYLSGNQAAANAVANGFVNPDFTKIQTAYMADAATKQLDVGCWTVNTQAEYHRVTRLGVRHVTTDNIAPNRPAVGKVVATYASNLNFPTCVMTNGAISAGQGVATINAGGNLVSPTLATSAFGAVYSNVTLQGNARVDLLLNGAVNESVTVDFATPADVNFSKLVHSSGGTFAVRVTQLGGANVTVSDLTLLSKQLIVY